METSKARKFIPAEGYTTVVLETLKKSESGLYIPDNALTDRISKAIVIGSSKQRIETTSQYTEAPYAVGQTVLFLKGNGYNIKVDSVDMIILKNEEILGVLEE